MRIQKPKVIYKPALAAFVIFLAGLGVCNLANRVWFTSAASPYLESHNREEPFIIQAIQAEIQLLTEHWKINTERELKLVLLAVSPTIEIGTQQRDIIIFEIVPDKSPEKPRFGDYPLRHYPATNTTITGHISSVPSSGKPMATVVVITRVGGEVKCQQHSFEYNGRQWSVIMDEAK